MFGSVKYCFILDNVRALIRWLVSGKGAATTEKILPNIKIFLIYANKKQPN